MLRSKIIQTIIIMLFLIHPSITQFMFMAFSCISVDNVERLYEDLEVLCNGNAHKFLSKAVALPAFLLWGVGIPTFGLYIVIANRKNLSLNNIRQRFGFLYSGYRVP